MSPDGVRALLGEPEVLGVAGVVLHEPGIDQQLRLGQVDAQLVRHVAEVEMLRDYLARIVRAMQSLSLDDRAVVLANPIPVLLTLKDTLKLTPEQIDAVIMVGGSIYQKMPG